VTISGKLFWGGSTIFLKLFKVFGLVAVLLSGSVFAHGNAPGAPDPHCSFKVAEAVFYLNAHLKGSTHQNRHFCHFYPRLGEVAFSLTDKSGAAAPLLLQLLSFSSALAEIVLDGTVESRPAASPAQLSKVFTERGLYMLRINAQQNKESGLDSTYIWLAVGLPIAEIFLGLAGFFLILIIYYAIVPNKNKLEP
jgi:hypothetical protein